MNHEEEVKRILSVVSPAGLLRSRESKTVEYKVSFNKGSTATYARSMAAFANNRGGYIIFGVKDKPRTIVGLANDNFENLNQEQFTDAVNSLFAPAIDWECGTFILVTETSIVSSGDETETQITEKKIGWLYAAQAEDKPIIAQKSDSGEKISSGDIFYRYRARIEKIRYAEMRHIIDERATKDREHLLKLIEIIRKSDTTKLGIVNYEDGKFSTPYGVDVSIEHKLVAQILKKAKFIKEGSFDETKGVPVIKVTGNIDLAEGVPVPEIDPDQGYPYIQKDLAEKLEINSQDLYALIFHYKMKDSKLYSIRVTTSRVGGHTFKFSEFALKFLSEKLVKLKDNVAQYDVIRQAFKNRYKGGGRLS